MDGCVVVRPWGRRQWRIEVWDERDRRVAILMAETIPQALVTAGYFMPARVYFGKAHQGDDGA